MKKYDIKHLSIKSLSEATKETTVELDGVIKSLGGTYPPQDPRKTYVTYTNGNVNEYDISGTLGQESIASLEDAIELNIGTHVTDIGSSLFYGNNSLSSVTFPTSITSIGDLSFKGTDITSVTIPSSVLSIGESAFEDCYNLSSVEIQNGVTDIGSYAFSGCEKLLSIMIPSTVSSIGERLLNISYGSTGFNIYSIVVDPNNTTYDSRDNCNAIIRTADNTLIQGCNNTIIPNTVTNIDNYAMQFTKITSFSIPSSVTSIGLQGFYGCSNLSSLTIPSTVTSIGYYSFNQCPATVTFEGRNKATVSGMTNFRWGIGTNKIICIDGTL